MSIKSDFDTANKQRQTVLDRLRACAAFTIPWVLPNDDIAETDEILQPYQALGAQGVENLVGKLLVSLFPTGTPWWSSRPSAEARAGDLPPDVLEAFANHLAARDLLIEGKLDSTNYRMAQRSALEQIIVLGNSMTRLTSDYQTRGYRPDQYVQRRIAGKMVWLIVAEAADVLMLNDETLAKAALSRTDFEGKPIGERIKTIYTQAERQSDDRWVMTQELNEHEVQTSEEPSCPFFACGYREIPGESWSRGFVEARLGDLRSFNGLARAIVDLTVAAARCVPVADPRHGWKASDLTRPNGVVVLGKVEGSIPHGVGFLQSNKAQDISVAQHISDQIEKRLGKAFLLETFAQPEGERVTAAQIMRIARELEGALGGVYAHIADEIQKPFLARFIWQMEKDNLLPAMPETVQRGQRVTILTGIEALRRQAELERLLGAMQILSSIPGALEKLKFDVIAERILRYLGVETTNLIKTPEELQAEIEANAQQLLQTEAGKKAIETIGNVAEKAAVA